MPKQGGNRPTIGRVRVKGVNFILLLDALVKIYGQDTRQRIEKEATGELADALRFGSVVLGGWYDVELYRSLWHLIGSQLTLDEGGIRRLTQKAAALSVNGIYTALAKISTPSMLISLSSKVFANYYEGAQFRVKESRPEYIACEWSECVGFDKYLWNSVLGGAVYFLELAGAQSVEYRVLEGGGNSSRMLVDITYHN